MIKSDSIKELSTALSKAQGLFSSTKKSKTNPHLKSKYSTIEDVIKVIKKPIADNGLSYSQFPITESGFVGVETIIMHNSGEFISEKFLLPVIKQDPQGYGSAISYAKRYALQSAFGVASDDDDDGESHRTTPGIKETTLKPQTILPIAKVFEWKCQICKDKITKEQYLKSLTEKKQPLCEKHVNG